MRINDDFIKCNAIEKCLLVPVGDNYRFGVFKLNETAERIFDLLKEGKSRDEVIVTMREEYSSDDSEISEFVDGYIEELRKAQVLIDD